MSAGEVAIGRVGHHAGAACGLTQNHRIGAAVACQRDACVQ